MKQLIALTRSGYIESIHYGYICAVKSDGHVEVSLGDPDLKMFLRSTAKPFQALAFVASGAIDHYQITPQELALICSSHSGQAVHRELVQTILDKGGLTEEQLDCGIMKPYNTDTTNQLIREGKRPTKLHNCCSGKHSGMLLLCKYKGFPTEGYVNYDHPVQQLILRTIAEVLGCSIDEIPCAIDGCGVPNPKVTVQQGAYLYAQLAGATPQSKYGPAFKRIREAMADNSRMISGDGEFCTDLIRFSQGKAIGKMGGEGVYGIGLPDQKMGVCIKILDGAERALYPTAVAAARQLGALNKLALENLQDWAYPPVTDHKGDVVGYTIPVFDFDQPHKAEVCAGLTYDEIGKFQKQMQ